MFLALETSTFVCSVAFQNCDGKIVEKRSDTHGSHSENLFLFIDELMNEHGFTVTDLEAVLISEGPGSYTGLRIAASAVKGLLFNQDIPLLGVNTLVSFAQSAIVNTEGSCCIHSIIDARRKHVYYQKFVYDEKLRSKSKVEITPIVQFEKEVQEDDIIIGTGLNRIGNEMKAKARVFDKKYITAKSLISLHEGAGSDFIHEIKPEDFEPQYYTSRQVS